MFWTVLYTYNQIAVGNVTLPKAVLSTVKIFAVYYISFLHAWGSRGRKNLQTQKTVNCTFQ